MNATSYMMMLLMSIVCILGFAGFGSDIATHYGTTMPENLTNTANDVLENMNETSNTFYNVITNEGGWLQTSFNVFFTLPSSLLTTLLSLPGFGGNLVVVGLAEAGITPPEWFIPVVGITLMLLILMVIFSIIFNRGST